MGEQSITNKPIGHFEWLNNLVFGEKGDGRLYVCLYPRYWNKVIKKVTPPNAYFVQITPKLSSFTVFSE